jgi:ATP-dependent DNA ligase
VGNEILIKAISKACGKGERQIKEEFAVEGDLGVVAAQSKSSQKTMDTFFKKKAEPDPLTVSKTFL